MKKTCLFVLSVVFVMMLSGCGVTSYVTVSQPAVLSNGNFQYVEKCSAESPKSLYVFGIGGTNKHESAVRKMIDDAKLKDGEAITNITCMAHVRFIPFTWLPIVTIKGYYVTGDKIRFTNGETSTVVETPKEEAPENIVQEDRVEPEKVRVEEQLVIKSFDNSSKIVKDDILVKNLSGKDLRVEVFTDEELTDQIGQRYMNMKLDAGRDCNIFTSISSKKVNTFYFRIIGRFTTAEFNASNDNLYLTLK